MLKVSRGMRIRVENYAKDTLNFPLADKLELRWETVFKNQPLLQIYVEVHNEKSKLFELRTRLLHGTFSLPILSKITKCKFFKSETSVLYKFTYDAVDALVFVNGILGKWISTSIELSELCTNPPLFPYDAAAKILNEIHAPLLRIKAKLDNSALCLLNEEFLRNIDEIELAMYRHHAITDPKVLLKLISRHVHSICIDLNVSDHDDSHRTFAIPGHEWPPLILEMFSKKTNKLTIMNRDRDAHLNEQETDFLRERLPQLNKKIFFKASTASYRAELDYTLNEFTVKTSIKDKCIFIIHNSRKDERDMN